MGIIVSVYARIYYQERILPSVRNADYSLSIHKNLFGLSEDLAVRFDNIDDMWRILPNESYMLLSDQVIRNAHVLSDGEVIKVITSNQEQIILMIREDSAPFRSYTKYSLSGLNQITIGRHGDNTIQYDYQGLVSGHHAHLERKGSNWIIRNTGSNGSYLNSKLLDREKSLRFGDYINIFGLHLVFLGDYLAVDEGNHLANVNESVLKRTASMDEEEKGYEEKLATPETMKVLFHRSPRNIEWIDTQKIEIEGPPTLQKAKPQPLFLTIGPSFTMAIPMLLGCLLMIYSSRATGGSTGLFMYSGLVMAVSSAFIGVFWAIQNLRFQKKSEKEEEKRRFDAYGQYLVEKTEEIRKKYDGNVHALQEMYPDSKVCATYNENSPELWNRNKTHADFLCCRIGTGDIPFQAQINIPKQKFAVVIDPLELKPSEIQNNFKTLYKVPILADILHHPMIGIVGGRNKKGAIDVAKLLVTQIVATHCYTDVKLGFIYNGADSSDSGQWDFARWLPHCWAEDRKIRYVASDREQISDVCYELTKIFRQRKEERAEGVRTKISGEPHYVLFIMDLSLIEQELLYKYVCDQDESMGLSVLILADTFEHLPNNCDFVISNDGIYSGMYCVSKQSEEKTAIAFDSLGTDDLDQLARRLSNIVVQENTTGGEIPLSLTFFDMYGVSKPSELGAAERWLKNRTYENIRGLVGQKAGGAGCYLDVHEKYHGPHGLVAGTTGSGKSETLQTFMLSLALNYSPDDVEFFIIDYKGGGMANLFDRLPHLVGQISNLSGNQVHRAMVSIKSENHRRQRIFNESGVNNINAYTKLFKNKEASEPVPHLFIIIDEFAELKKEEPDFMRELISVAQVGRSLGVHLILATQKPSGTVDDNIWSNSKFRLCLRVQDKEDSMDMLHKPDAAYITQAGRCYLQVGSDEVYELFQSGWSGAPYDDSYEAGGSEAARLITLTGRVDVVGGYEKSERKKKAVRNWIQQLTDCIQEALSEQKESLKEICASQNLTADFVKQVLSVINLKKIEFTPGRYNEERLEDLIRLCAKHNCDVDNLIEDAAAKGIRLPAPKEKTELSAVIEYLARTAEENGYEKGHQLWMPVLPDKIYLDEFEEFSRNSFRDGMWPKQIGSWSLGTVIGKADDPMNQAQMPLSLSFSENGHLAVIGSVVSGKSTFFQTLIFAMTMKYDPQYLNIYGIDFSSKMMSAFESAPQVGGIVYEGEDKKIAKLFHMINEILEERKQLFRGGNYSQYIQVNGVIYPAILLFIDNFSAFKEKTEEKYLGDIVKLSKEGVSHGIYLVISAGGFGINELSGRIAENMRMVVSLEMPDKYAYADVLHTMKIDVLPETGIKGRGLAYHYGQLLEFQTALALRAEDDYQRMERISEVSQMMSRRWEGKRPRSIPEIPEKPVWTEFCELDDVKSAASAGRLLPVAYDEESANIYSIDLRKIYCYLITGIQHTGKRNYMKIMIQSASMAGAEIYVLDDGTDMNMFTGDSGITFIRGLDELFNFCMETLTPTFQERNRIKKELEEAGAEEDEIFESSLQFKPMFLFIPDLFTFASHIYGDERNISGFMETLIKKGRLNNIYFVAILSLENRSDAMSYQLVNEFAEYRNGIHFGGNVVQNPMMNFDYLGYQKQSGVLKPGIGILPDVGGEHDTERIVVPLARWKRE